MGNPIRKEFLSIVKHHWTFIVWEQTSGLQFILKLHLTVFEITKKHFIIKQPVGWDTYVSPDIYLVITHV